MSIAQIKAAIREQGFARWLREAVLDFWFAPVRAERLLLFQRVFTLTFFLYLVGWTSSAREWLTDEGFHLSAWATNPAYPAPWPTVPVAWLPAFLVLLFGTTWAVILDVGGRTARALLCFLAVYVQMVDQPSSFTLNKIYVVFFFVLAVAPARLRVRERAGDDEGSPERIVSYQAAWPVRLIQAVLLIQYCTAGICKIAWGDWLFRPDILFTHTVGIYRTEIAAWVVHHLPFFLWSVFAWGALLFELLAPLFFIPKKLRVVAIPWGIGFHGSVAILMKDLIFFSQQMISVYILFLPERWCVVAEEWLGGRLARVKRGLRGMWPRVRA